MNNEARKIGEANRAAIRQWFVEHLCGTQRECARDLKLSEMAVNRGVKAIRAEWRTEPKSELYDREVP